MCAATVIVGVTIVSGITVPAASAAVDVAYTDSLAAFNTAAFESQSTGTTIVYQADRSHPLPAAHASGEKGVVATTASVIIIPNASGIRKDRPRPRPGLLPDDHEGEELRCENNANAVVAGKHQNAELYTPAEAWERMHQPTVLLNANYFEVRPQAAGTKWGTNKCSSPYGMYYDNHPGSSQDPAVHGGPYFEGLAGFYQDETGESAPLDTLFFIDENSRGPRPTSSFELVTNSDPSSLESVNRAKELESLGEQFTAVSGTALLPRAGAGGDLPSPDSRASSTTRIAVGYDRGNDRLLILQGGGYRDGFTRQSLTAVMRALNSTLAIELDGGGSASVAVSPAAVLFRGTSTRSTYLKCEGQVCYSPVVQPSGSARPVPAWMTIRLNF
ncbi:phosphodiester glycosidase family protein [Microbacterium sp. 1.5R]|uniref:phosphodiester glycosidase family protein n=1 Tax=Microbacterium sp. 1.5R TaxID=1916917 RepID=UPI0011A2C07E|nr:phosphodiester glycosidase family protein [Microbacterium sp. 1.5R]